MIENVVCKIPFEEQLLQMLLLGMKSSWFSRTDLTDLISGKYPWQQNFPVKSSLKVKNQFHLLFIFYLIDINIYLNQ